MSDHRWWQRGVVYQIYPRSFLDSNGDGVGDLAGITASLGYVQALGIDAVWISPFYPSPMADFGYDITDHTGVDPLFGTLEDFDGLVARAHQVGISVLLDYVPNHTSDEHPWFLEARSSRDSARRAWYLWADPAPGGGPPNNWRSVFGGTAWTLDARTGQYYYHAFLPEQPDLNWHNPQVRQAQFDVMRFWLDRGVDGFRIDACRHLIKDTNLRDNPPNPGYRDGLPPFDALLPTFTTDRPETLQIVAEMRRVMDEHSKDGLLLGELYLPHDRLMRYYGERGNGMHLPSNMHLISVPYRAQDIAALVDGYERVLPDGAWPNWTLGNHDRGRLATRLGDTRTRVAAMLLLTLRGTPVLYYGDEIGMRDVPVPNHLVQDPYAKRVPGVGAGRDPQRSPMQWSPAPHAGFCPPHAVPWLPVAPDADLVNVECQQRDPRSILNLYRRLLALRRSEPALSVGTYALERAEDSVLVYRRQHERRTMVIALNLGPRSRSVPLAHGGAILVGTRLDRDGERVGDAVTLRGDEGVIIAAPTPP